MARIARKRSTRKGPGIGRRVGKPTTRTRAVKGGTRRVRTTQTANRSRSTESTRRVGKVQTKGGLKRRTSMVQTGQISTGKRSRTVTRGVTRTKNGASAAKRITRTKMSGPAGSGTKRTAAVKTRGGLKRTAKVTKTTTGSGAARVTKTKRVVTRVKNGRKVKKVVTRVNKGGKVTTKANVKVTGKGPKSTKPRPKAKRTALKNGGTTAPRAKKARKRSR